MANRIEREKNTVRAMIELYCHRQHHTKDELCAQCQELQDYAFQRLGHCKFGEQKPTCGKCTVHCYKPDRRRQVIEVMRYSGPKMLYHHPNIALQHLLDGLRSKA